MKCFAVSWVSLAAVLGLLSPAGSAQARHINLVTIQGSINPASANYLIAAIEKSEGDGAAALLIELDTPGGLVASTKDIVQAMLNATVPVIVYVSPSGAWASSAGTFITIAAHVAAMAPGTSIGAASPVSAVGGGGERSPTGEDEEGKDGASTPSDTAMAKAENFLTAFIESIAERRNRNVEWVAKAVRDAEAITDQKAVELNVVDLVANSRTELLEKIEGRMVDLNGEEQPLELAGASVKTIEMTLMQALFDFLANPNVAVVLLMAGLLGLYVEVNNPGLILPGVAGAVCLLLTGIAFQILPFDWVGVMFMLLGIGLLVAEIFVTSFGLLFAAGIVCFLLGGTMLFDRPDLSDLNVSFWSVLVPAVMAVAVFGGIVILSVGRTFGLGQAAGVDELVGLVGRVSSQVAPAVAGKVFVRGEYWNAESESDEIREGEAVEIVRVEGLKLKVKRAG